MPVYPVDDILISYSRMNVLFRADPDKGLVNKNIDYGLQANIAIELVKAMFSEAPCKRSVALFCLLFFPLPWCHGMSH